MSYYGAPKVITCAVASGASIGNADLGQRWEKVYLDNEAPGAAMTLYAARTSGGTYKQVLWPNTHTVANAVTIGSATSGKVVEVPLGGLQYVQVALTATAANGTTLYFICS